MGEFWAVLEASEGKLHEQSGELLGEVADAARRQAEAGSVCAVLLYGSGAPQIELPERTWLVTLGVERLYLLKHPQLGRYTTSGYVSALTWLMRQCRPGLVAASATPNGCDWTARLAARLRLPFVPGCLGFDVHDDALLGLRMLYEGRAYAQTRTALRGRTALVTLIPGIRGTPGGLSAKGGGKVMALEVTRFTPELGQEQGSDPGKEGRIRQLALRAPSPEAVELDAAERIVAGGRGVGREGFAALTDFAHRLGAAVGASRVATDLGWIEHARQIGATGKIVRPRLYIACGISGAAQHTSGMSEAQTVVAINPDRGAPIFALADLGLLGDANQVLPLAAEMLDKDKQ